VETYARIGSFQDMCNIYEDLDEDGYEKKTAHSFFFGGAEGHRPKRIFFLGGAEREAQLFSLARRLAK